jgi:hypothetical protein
VDLCHRFCEGKVGCSKSLLFTEGNEGSYRNSMASSFAFIGVHSRFGSRTGMENEPLFPKKVEMNGRSQPRMVTDTRTSVSYPRCGLRDAGYASIRLLIGQLENARVRAFVEVKTRVSRVARGIST